MPFAFVVVMAVLIVIKLFERRVPRIVKQGFVVVALSLPVVLTIYAGWLLWREPISWLDIILFSALAGATGLGTTLGLHRLLTHRSFETVPSVKLLFLVLGAMANQGRPIDWAANHLKHHAYSDRKGDPHSPMDGFFHAH